MLVFKIVGALLMSAGVYTTIAWWLLKDVGKVPPKKMK